MKKKRESGADKSESRASKRRAVSVELWLFCERGTDAGSLHQVSMFELPDSDSPTMYDCLILDGAVVVHFLPTEAVRTFSEYADKVFIPYVKKQLERATRVDVVWDTYVPDSLKESTQEKKEEREFAGKCQGKPNSRVSGWTFFVTQKTTKNYLHL